MNVHNLAQKASTLCFVYAVLFLGISLDLAIAQEATSVVCETDKELRKVFSDGLAQWKARYINVPVDKSNPVGLSSDPLDYMDNPDFQSIMGLGPAALPLFIETVEREWVSFTSECMRIAIALMTKTRMFVLERGKESILAQYQKQLECDAAKFETVYREWKNAPDNKEKARRDFLFLGIAALPHAIEHLRNGETELMDAIDYWTDNKPNEAFAKLEGEKTSKKDFYLAWWEKNKDFWLLPQLKKPSESKE